MPLALFFFMTRMEGRNPYMGVGALGKIFVTFQSNGHPDLSLRGAGRGHRRCAVGVNDPQDVTLAAHRHTLAERDLRRHAESQLDLRTLCEWCIREEEHSPRTQILGKTDAFNAIAGLTKRSSKKVREALSDPAFNLKWRSGHWVTSFGRIAEKAQTKTLAHIG